MTGELYVFQNEDKQLFTEYRDLGKAIEEESWIRGDAVELRQ